MTDTRNLTLAKVEEFLNAPKVADFSVIDHNEAYGWIENCLNHFSYRKLKRRDKTLVRKYIRRTTGYSRAQTNRLIRSWKRTGHIKRLEYKRSVFPRFYTREDIALLAETDKAHNFLSGPATAAILKREYEEFGNFEYKRLSKISASHIYNLRDHQTYQNVTRYFAHTKPTGVKIGERRKPLPDGRPGFIRVDSVHQGDSLELGKGVYHINFIDEVTQWEMVACVSVISENYLMPILEMILETLPFNVLGFHSDNGSEYINHTVARLLNKLHIDQTKSRPRKSNDNALIETKNGSVVRKHMGYHFIDKSAAPLINEWYQRYFNPYLNFHRPCAFGTVITDKRGKEKIIYKHEDYMPPYEKLKSLPNAEQYLKPGITFKELDKLAYSYSDTEFAKEVAAAKRTLFVKIGKLKNNQP